MKTITIANKKGLELVGMQPFGKAKIAYDFAKNLIDDNATGNKMRVHQMFATRYEIEVDGNLYVIEMRDSGQNTEIQEGSDL